MNKKPTKAQIKKAEQTIEKRGRTLEKKRASDFDKHKAEARKKGLLKPFDIAKHRKKAIKEGRIKK